jgi:small subunit ribosomal protein S23e
MSGGKPRGLNAARKLRTNRREQRWADLSYKKRALGTAFKSRCATTDDRFEAKRMCG